MVNMRCISKKENNSTRFLLLEYLEYSKVRLSNIRRCQYQGQAITKSRKLQSLADIQRGRKEAELGELFYNDKDKKGNKKPKKWQ